MVSPQRMPDQAPSATAQRRYWIRWLVAFLVTLAVVIIVILLGTFTAPPPPVSPQG
ncbi:MAG: hypothetical protein QM692_22680 [Thermomicrobiales bacterium]